MNRRSNDISGSKLKIAVFGFLALANVALMSAATADGPLVASFLLATISAGLLYREVVVYFK